MYVLLVIDVQNDFCLGGVLVVVGGDEIVDGINVLMIDFDVVILMQDWYFVGYSLFVLSYQVEFFLLIDMFYGFQVFWFDYCVQGMDGVVFYDGLCIDVDLIICKGYNFDIDSYFVFFENDKIILIGLDGYLKICGVMVVILVGLVMDYCVVYLVLDVVKFGYKMMVIINLCCVIDFVIEVIVCIEMIVLGVILIQGVFVGLILVIVLQMLFNVLCEDVKILLQV